jgi:hypothetical protein
MPFKGPSTKYVTLRGGFVVTGRWDRGDMRDVTLSRFLRAKIKSFYFT